MCKTAPKVAGSARATQLVGRECPVCETPGVALDLMRFLDPHGVQRVDDDIFECSVHRHTFVICDEGLRLIASDGRRDRDRRVFPLD